MSDQLFFKITNQDECHHGFQYHTGLNILVDKFEDDPNRSCCRGGLYIADGANILRFMRYGKYIRRVILPVDNPDFKMVLDKEEYIPKSDNPCYKFRANMIILNERLELDDPHTFRYLSELGVNIHARGDALRYSVMNGNLNVVRYLVENGADIHKCKDLAFRQALESGNVDVYEYLKSCD